MFLFIVPVIIGCVNEEGRQEGDRREGKGGKGREREGVRRKGERREDEYYDHTHKKEGFSSLEHVVAADQSTEDDN